jgi:ABC-type lipoprotein release transport system permease subunit
MRFEHWIYTVRLVASLLYGLTPDDPLTIAAATILLVVAAALASLIPARRAAMVDPIVVLRYE